MAIRSVGNRPTGTELGSTQNSTEDCHESEKSLKTGNPKESEQGEEVGTDQAAHDLHEILKEQTMPAKKKPAKRAKKLGKSKKLEATKPLAVEIFLR
jgi:hypothetical protein